MCIAGCAVALVEQVLGHLTCLLPASTSVADILSKGRIGFLLGDCCVPTYVRQHLTNSFNTSGGQAQMLKCLSSSPGPRARAAT